jgi:hypothetical protein
MMNRIFDPQETIDVGGDEAAAPEASRPDAAGRAGRRRLPTAKPAGPSPAAAGSSPHRTTVVLLATLGGVCMVSAASTMLYLRHWNQAQETLQQERNLLLVERLRTLGPATPAPLPAPQAPPTAVAGVAAVPTVGDDGLPPPPDEPWIEELDRLPTAVPPRPLKVPVAANMAAPPPAAAPAPAAAPTPRGAGPAPLLVGVVGAQGQAGSAIFQMGGSSTSVSVGEAIGGTGWRLRSADGDTAVIERGGESRVVSIGNGE